MDWFHVDKDEFEIFEIYPDLLEKLLTDKTSNKHIIWATNNYKGRGYKETDVISIDAITGRHKNLIKPRIAKSKTEQVKRSKDMAEVFTPSWVCNKQNNLIDNEWFCYDGAFNIENDDNTWTSTEKVDFKTKKWTDYVSDVRLEITCGEAPYLVSRYDTVSGERIDIKSRIGILDRKLRVVNENACNDDEWIDYSLIALKSSYGYEYQGDSLLIARENVLFTYLDYYYERFKSLPNKELMDKMVEIITWNLWQMDGLKMVIPFSCKDSYVVLTDIFGTKETVGTKCPGCQSNNIYRHNGIYSKIMDWEENKKVKFVNFIKGGMQ